MFLLRSVPWFASILCKMLLLLGLFSWLLSNYLSSGASINESGEISANFSNTDNSTSCKDPGGIIRGRRHPEGRGPFPHGTVLTYSCYRIFTMLLGDGNMTCVSGKWIPANKPVCMRRSKAMSKSYCRVPRKPLYGDILRPYKFLYAVNETVSFLCDFGYTLTGPSQLTCTDEGTWQPTTLPECQSDHVPYWMNFPKAKSKSYCRVPRKPLYGDILRPYKFLYAVNETVSFLCDFGYTLTGPSQLTCTDEGTWQPTTLPECQSDHVPFLMNIPIDVMWKGCKSVEPSSALNLDSFLDVDGTYDSALLLDSFVKRNGLYAVNSTIYFYCNQGFHLIGSSTITCTSNGTWQPDSLPVCRSSADDSGQKTTSHMWKFSFIPVPIGLLVCFRIFVVRSGRKVCAHICTWDCGARETPVFRPSSNASVATDESIMVIEDNTVSVQPAQHQPISNWSSNTLPTYEEATKTDISPPSFEAACAMVSSSCTKDFSQKR